MEKEVFNKPLADAIIAALQQGNKASVFDKSTQRPIEVQAVTLSLTTASQNPFKIGFPFKSVYVSSATDVNVSINLKPISQDSFQSSIPLKLNDSWEVDYQINEAYISWNAQSGKSITLLFFVNSAFRSGSQISVTGGGVSISEGSSFSTSPVTVGVSTATLICASNYARKLATLQNNTGSDVWLGGSLVSNTGANLGYKIPAGGSYQWRNSSALYAYSVGGGAGDNGILVKEES